MRELSLPEGVVDVWQFQPENHNIQLHPLERVLSEDERHRADRFRLPHLRRNYILSRGSLRLLCSRYLDTDPAALTFRYQTKGKPDLGEGCKLHFNVSHSGGLIVFAFTWDLELGIDLEKVRHIRDIDAIAHRFFCPEEAALVLGAPEDQRALLFHTCWTRKEAFIKATGDGLSTALNSFQVHLDPTAPASMVHVNFDYEEGGRWTMQSLELAAPYVGALCYRSPRRSIRLLTYPPGDGFGDRYIRYDEG
jgi:4'-phosphopantetheinyl transferase